MFDTLLSSSFTKPNILISSIKKLSLMRLSSFIYTLSSQDNISISYKYLTIQIKYISSENRSFGSEKLTKAVSDLPIFSEGKDFSIDQ